VTIKSFFSFSKECAMSLYDDIFKNLIKTGKLDLVECRELSCEEMDALVDEIRFWSVYGSGRLDKLRNEKKSNKSYV
jgi:hypothetical protein